MIVLLAVAIGTGIVTAVVLIPVSPLMALLVVPLVASVSTMLAGLAMAWRSRRRDRLRRVPEVKASVMATALRDVIQPAEQPSPAPKVSRPRHGA